jgi:hypothetical protein
VASAGDERAAVALDVRERAKAVVLQLEDPIRMSKGSATRIRGIGRADDSGTL